MKYTPHCSSGFALGCFAGAACAGTLPLRLALRRQADGDHRDQLGTGAIPAEKTAAKRKLADYLKKITGVGLGHRGGKGLQGRLPVCRLHSLLGARGGFHRLWREESLLETAGDSLIVGGGRPRGTSTPPTSAGEGTGRALVHALD